MCSLICFLWYKVLVLPGGSSLFPQDEATILPQYDLHQPLSHLVRAELMAAVKAAQEAALHPQKETRPAALPLRQHPPDSEETVMKMIHGSIQPAPLKFLVCVENEESGWYPMLRTTLRRYGIRPGDVLVVQKVSAEASGVTGADQLSALKLVTSQLDSNQLLVFLDAEDLYLMEGDTSEIVQKFGSLAGVEVLFPCISVQSKHYLNAALFIGRAGPIQTLLQGQPWRDGANCREYFTQLYDSKKHPHLALDTSHLIFQASTTAIWSQLQQGDKLRWRIKSTQTHPSIFHFDSISPDAQLYAGQLPPITPATPKVTKSTQSSSAVVFYNIYVPDVSIHRAIGKEANHVDASTDERHAKGIIDEQIAMLPDWVSEVQYNTIGKDKVVPQWLANCDRCKHLKHYPEATEVETVQNMYDYCQKNPDSHVVYMHDKGSLHDPPPQTMLRHLLTRSIFTPECSPVGMPDTCNICSARFTTVPHYHTSGNMFSARCSYIRQLYKPQWFEGAMNRFFSSDHYGGRVQPNDVPLNACFPTGRFVIEHWAWSHPMVSPCDVYPGSWIWGIGNRHSWDTLGNDALMNSWKIDLQSAPRYAIDTFWSVVFQEDTPGMEGEQNWQHAMHSLARWLNQWRHVYAKVPPRDSWVWSFYLRDHMEREHGFVLNEVLRKA